MWPAGDKAWRDRWHRIPIDRLRRTPGPRAIARRLHAAVAGLAIVWPHRRGGSIALPADLVAEHRTAGDEAAEVAVTLAHRLVKEAYRL